MKTKFDDILLRHLRGMTFEDTLSLLLDEFKEGKTFVTWHNTGQSMTLDKIAKIRQYQGLDAERVGPLEFWGGPTAKRKHFTGSLLTVLCDRILLAWSMNGEYKSLVEVPPEVEYPVDA